MTVFGASKVAQVEISSWLFNSQNTIHSFLKITIKSESLNNDLLSLPLLDVGVSIVLVIVRVSDAWSLVMMG